MRYLIYHSVAKALLHYSSHVGAFRFTHKVGLAKHFIMLGEVNTFFGQVRINGDGYETRIDTTSTKMTLDVLNHSGRVVIPGLLQTMTIDEARIVEILAS